MDADIRSFFDAVSQDWLIRFLEHRIADWRILRLIRKWLKAGILEDGVVSVSDRWTGQGSVISPLLANVYLHYVFDLWAERSRRRQAAGDMIVVRYADDTIVGFEHEADSRRFLEAMRERLAAFALELHPEKTWLIAFGRRAAQNRARRGRGKPETLNFLGFTLISSQSRRGKFLLKRKSRRDRLRAKLQEIKGELQRRMHEPIPELGKWPRQVITGVITTNTPSMSLSHSRQSGILSLDERKRNRCVALFAASEIIEKILPNASAATHCLPLDRGIDPHKRWPRASHVHRDRRHDQAVSLIGG